VSAIDPGLAWAVGDDGTILFHDGDSWAPQTGGTANILRGVSALDSDHVWAVGDGGTILFHDGDSWALQASGTTTDLLGVSAADPLHVWAVGAGGTILFYDGTLWRPQTSGVMHTLWGVSALDSEQVWAVGDGGTVLFHDSRSWAPQTSGTMETLRGVSTCAAPDGWGALAVGDRGVIVSKVESFLQGTVLNVTINNYLTENISFSNARDPSCINSYTLPDVPAGNALIPGQATITADPKGSGFRRAFSDSDMYVSIRPSGGASIGLLRLNKFPGASWKIWIEDALPGYSLSPSRTLKNRWTLAGKELK
jgi:hypothetical protein